MNTLIVGLPGNGKGLKGMQLLVDELRLGTRPVITNLAVEKWPWVTNKHKPERGLISYLQETYSDDFNCVERIFRVSDEAIQNFYLYRALSRAKVKKLVAAHLVGYRQVTALDGVLDEQELHTHKDFQLYVCDHVMTTDKNLRKHCQNFNAVLLEHSGPHLNIADECWKFWPARGWQSTSDADVFYNAQHRHFGDDNLYLTQRHNDIDSIIVERCQNSIVMTHHGKMSLGIFRQPDLFSESVYQGRPMPSKEPMSRRVFRLDVKGLGGCYDTSAGVGITGRSAADVGSRKIKGLPFWMMPVAVLLVLFVIGYTIKFGASFVVGALNGKRKPVAHVVAPAVAKKAETAAVLAPEREINSLAGKVSDGSGPEFARNERGDVLWLVNRWEIHARFSFGWQGSVERVWRGAGGSAAVGHGVRPGVPGAVATGGERVIRVGAACGLRTGATPGAA